MYAYISSSVHLLSRVVLPLGVGAIVLAVGACGDGSSDDPDFPFVTVDGEPVLISEGIRARIEADASGERTTTSGTPLFSGEVLASFYADRGYAPAWIDDDGLTDRGEALAEWLHEIQFDGLDPAHYRVDLIDSMNGWGKDRDADAEDRDEDVEARDQDEIAGGQDRDEDAERRYRDRPSEGQAELDRLVDLDLLLTDAFMMAGSHLLHGRLDRETHAPEWRADRNEVSMDMALRNALQDGDVLEALDGLRPPSPAYDALRETLRDYHELAENGGWRAVPEVAGLAEGSRDAAVVALRERLAATGDYADEPEAADDPELFDEDLHEAVVVFQRRHGLAGDGVVTEQTLEALNVPVEERIRQLQVNLERWRWLEGNPGDRYILVNIPAFETEVVIDGERKMTLRSVVGEEYRETPVFSHEMTYLVLAPYWNVPASIQVEDHLPRIREDIGFLESRDMVLLDRETEEEVDPEDIDWDDLDEEKFEERLRIRQEPGPLNALGDVKFMFPNEHAVYLHDTVEPELFDEAVRTFSSGCIRVERALELAELLLEPDPDWDRDRIHEVLEEGSEVEVPLAEPIPIHIQYWTVWVDEEGGIQFRADLYNRNESVYEALQVGPPS